jgi:hypothetical protein
MIMAVLVQLTVTCVWAVIIGVHVRRLLRLAHIDISAKRCNAISRQGLDRIWWWLGRPEYWRDIARDCLQSLQLTLLFFLLATML